MKARWLKMPVSLLGNSWSLPSKRWGTFTSGFTVATRRMQNLVSRRLASTDRRWSGAVTPWTRNETGQRIADQTLVPVRTYLDSETNYLFVNGQ